MWSQSPIAEYGAALARELAFDSPLARRVRQEVEDHLLEASLTEGDEDLVAAQRRVVARFGDCRVIAAQYVASSLYRQTKHVGAVAVFVIGGIFLAMKGRLAWYGLMHWGMDHQLRAVLEIAMPIIRYNFMAALALGIIACAYSASHKTPLRLDPVHRRQLRVSQLLSAAATTAIGLSVVFDIAVTTLRLADVTWSVQTLVPLSLIAAETILALGLVAQLLGTVRRTSLASSLLDQDLARLA
jgi:DNA-binding phage protein